MAIKARPGVANVMGVLSVLLLTLLWGVVLDPLKWHPHFPGGVRGGAEALFGAVVTSVVASVWGKKVWLLVAAWAVFTFIYIGFFYQMPLWY